MLISVGLGALGRRMVQRTIVVCFATAVAIGIGFGGRYLAGRQPHHCVHGCHGNATEALARLSSSTIVIVGLALGVGVWLLIAGVEALAARGWTAGRAGRSRARAVAYLRAIAQSRRSR